MQANLEWNRFKIIPLQTVGHLAIVTDPRGSFVVYYFLLFVYLLYRLHRHTP